MSAAVRADFLDTSNEASADNGNKVNIETCQDGMTEKVIAVILGCPGKTHSDLEMRSTCHEDDFPKGSAKC